MSKNNVMYIGSYGDLGEATVHVAAIDQASGRVDVIQAYTGVQSASYLSRNSNGKILYAVQEVEETNGEPGGSVVAIAIDEESGLLQEIRGTALTGGAHPCYIHTLTDGSAVFVANYTGGNSAMLPLDSEGLFAGATAVIEHGTGSMVDPERQEAAHAHFVTAMPGTNFVCAVDLGMDAIIISRLDMNNKSIEKHNIVAMEPGSGPRHLVFHPKLPIAYVANELSSSITVLEVNQAAGSLQPVATVSSIPADYKEYNDAADIHISADGRFLYSSNRGHNSIAVYEVNQSTGSITPIQHISCGGELPRNFTLTPDGNYLLAANQKSGTIIVFDVNQDSGMLMQTNYKLELPSPVCIQFGN